MTDDRDADRALFAAAPDGMAVVDPETGRFRDVNERFCELYGYARSTLLDRSVGILTAADRSSPDDLLDRLREAGDGERFDWRTEHADGGTIPVEVAVSRVGDDGRLLVRVAERADAREQRAELDVKTRAMDEAPVGITISGPADEDTPLIYVNEEFLDLTGYQESEVLGRNCRFLQGENTSEDRVARLREAIDADEPVTVELRNYRRDGERFWNRVTVAPVRDDDGTVTNYVGFQQDVTERKRQERELERYQQRLEEQRDGLEILNQVVRHDIRNDLQLIIGHAERLEASLDDGDDGALSAIVESANNAVSLTRTARVLAETMLRTDAEPEPVALRPLLEAQIEEAASAHGAASITAEGDVPDVRVLADEMLASVFRNLLNNAVQHNDTDRPTVTVSVTEMADRVRVHVADDGPGVPDDRKEAVFGKGEKGLDSDGTGIGLYLVHSLVDQYGGEVWIDDSEAQSASGSRTQSGDADPRGAVFTVELPLA